ncbi:hypothetical protein PENSTE_c017G08005 [Penicillium steckii]|uniref:Uncharacterized protein n=1 Tax=Penicillium steckii TaxID=303698 RepID=A0A1V6SYU1_9EURO|nr:hypothetical protein PENSTE_c017G08005 [Penicillium steckii]
MASTGQSQLEDEEDPEDHHDTQEMHKHEPEVKTMHASCVHGDTQEPSNRFEMEGDLIDLDD